MTGLPAISVEPLGVTAFDMRPAQAAIRCQHGPRYHLSKAALWEVAALWGLTPGDPAINPHGVFADAETLIEVRGERSRAEICAAVGRNGLWAMSTSYMLPESGAGSAPGVWNSIAYRSREGARAAGLYVLESRFRAIAMKRGPNAKAASKLLGLLAAERAPQLQLL